MNILVVGDGGSEIHETVVAEAFRRLKHQVEVFYWCKYFSSDNYLIRQIRRLQNKFIFGPQVKRINKNLVEKALLLKPDVVFIYRGTHITSSTILSIKHHLPTCVVLGYNNDDPFSVGHPSYLWKQFKASVPYYDIVLAYRHHNIKQFLDIGAKRVELLRSWFVPWLNKPVATNLEGNDNYQCDVVFIGHYEADQRVDYLESIVKSGWNLKLFGPGYDWDAIVLKSTELQKQCPVRLVWGDDYNRALSGSRIALCFLSKLNRDTYTRRCFEIPATRTMMLAEYTDDLASLFVEGKDVEFFRTEEEMLEKIKIYINDDKRCQAIAESGYNRVHEDGHDVVSRMKQVLNWVEEI